MGYKAIVVGASGLVGSKLLTALLNHAEYDEVLILVRKELPVKHNKLIQLVISFEELNKYATSITGHAVFSCLGTTNANTPDKAQYRKIDHDYPAEIARLAKANGIKQFHVVTAVGADAKSATFYLKLKGELEDDLKTIGFESLHIYQPSMLYGGRKEQRPLENALVALFKVIDLLLIGGLRKYHSITADTVATAMLKNSLKTSPGTHIYTYDNIKNA
nr:NAD(P)H-binding protein [uncultured Mucilaginibacter sp.]